MFFSMDTLFEIIFSKKYDHAPIGQVADLQNDVRRKIGRSLVWFDASQDEVLLKEIVFLPVMNRRQRLIWIRE